MHLSVMTTPMYGHSTAPAGRSTVHRTPQPLLGTLNTCRHTCGIHTFDSIHASAAQCLDHVDWSVTTQQEVLNGSSMQFTMGVYSPLPPKER